MQFDFWTDNNDAKSTTVKSPSGNPKHLNLQSSINYFLNIQRGFYIREENPWDENLQRLSRLAITHLKIGVLCDNHPSTRSL